MLEHIKCLIHQCKKRKKKTEEKKEKKEENKKEKEEKKKRKEEKKKKKEERGRKRKKRRRKQKNLSYDETPYTRGSQHFSIPDSTFRTRFINISFK